MEVIPVPEVLEALALEDFQQESRSLVSTSKTAVVSLVTPVDTHMELHAVVQVEEVLPMSEFLVGVGITHRFFQASEALTRDLVQTTRDSIRCLSITGSPVIAPLHKATTLPRIPKDSTPDPTPIKVLIKALPSAR